MIDIINLDFKEKNCNELIKYIKGIHDDKYEYPNPIQKIKSIIVALNEADIELLILRFGLISGKSLTIEELSAKYNLTREEIVEKYSLAVRVLRHPSRWI